MKEEEIQCNCLQEMKIGDNNGGYKTKSDPALKVNGGMYRSYSYFEINNDQYRRGAMEKLSPESSTPSFTSNVKNIPVRSMSGGKNNATPTSSLHPQRATAAEMNTEKGSNRSILIPDGVKQNGFSSRIGAGHRADSGEEWIVPRPLRSRPKNQLKMEGSLDLKTTFQTTYEPTAEVMRERHSHRSERQIDVEPLPFRIRRSNYRPKTSLKPGGEGFYHTVTKDSFKRFVVVNVNNNNKMESHIKAKDITGNDEGKVVNESQLSIHDLSNKKKAMTTTSMRCSSLEEREIDATRTKREVDLLIIHDDDGAHEESREKEEVVEQEHHPDGSPFEEITTRDHQAQSSVTEVKASDNSKGESSDATEISQLGLHDSQGKYLQRNVPITTQLDNNVRKHHQETNTPSCYPNIPRISQKGRSHKHKNESQLRFNGQMDFQTTSRSYHRAASKSQECLASESQKNHGRRNLFQASEEVGRLGKGNVVVKGTTYSACFRDNFSCPAAKLDSPESEYKLKRKAGGHQFYCIDCTCTLNG